MRKYLKLCVLVIALAALMMLPAFAGSVTATKNDSVDGAGLVVKDDTDNQQFTASYSKATGGGQYLVLMVKGGYDSEQEKYIYEIDEDSADDILYVDQVQADSTTVSFTLYPSAVTNSVVLLAGEGLGTPVVLGSVEVAGVEVSGKVTSYLTGNATVTLLDNNDAVVATTTADADGNYSFDAVAAGEYTLEVSKVNHVTREYEITVAAEAVELDLKIHPIGDINGDGKILSGDNTLMMRHIRGTSLLTDYALKCADINKDGKILSGDNTLMMRHIRGTALLW